MGLRDRFRNRQGNDETQDGAGNYKYLIKKIVDNSYVVLDRDIVISDFEKRLNKRGIPITENQVIDGAGHTIDARGISRIFFIKEKNITLKNITFKNGFAEDGGGAIAVIESGSLKIEDCTFIGNASRESGGAIVNLGRITLENSDFNKNNSESDGGAISNQPGSELSFKNCSFKENNSQGQGGAILNWSKITITESNFENNNANKHAGTIYNIENATLNISKTNFIKNTTNGDGGALNNNMESSNMKVDDCRFIDNRSGAGGGAVVNWGKSIINNSEFKGNFSKTRGYDINFQKGSLKLSNIRFNNIKEKSIFSTNDDLVTIENCEFIEYDE